MAWGMRACMCVLVSVCRACVSACVCVSGPWGVGGSVAILLSKRAVDRCVLSDGIMTTGIDTSGVSTASVLSTKSIAPSQPRWLAHLLSRCTEVKMSIASICRVLQYPLCTSRLYP